MKPVGRPPHELFSLSGGNQWSTDGQWWVTMGCEYWDVQKRLFVSKHLYLLIWFETNQLLGTRRRE